jgi:exodeoxyribonuclease V beta subunit
MNLFILTKCGCPIWRQYYIPFIKYKDRNLFASRECEEWISVFRALDVDDFNGENDRLLSALFLTDFFNAGNSQNSKRRDDIGKIVMGWRKLASEGKYAEMLEAIYDQSDIQETLHNVKSIQSLGLIRQLGDYCIDYLYKKNTSIDSLIDHLIQRRSSDNNAGDDEGTLVEKSSDFDAVQMLTMHSAKGLEFPVVIPLYGLHGYRNMNSVVVFHDKGALCLGFDTYAKSMKNEECLQEWNRLFYVALTRATSLLILPVYDNINEKNKDDTLKKKGYDCIVQAFKPVQNSLNGFWEELKVADRSDKEWRDSLKAILSRSKEQEGQNGGQTQQKIVIGGINAALPTKIRRQHSYSSLTHHGSSSATLDNGRPVEGTAQEAPEETDEDIVQMQASSEPESYPRGASLGNALHNTLEAICNGEEGLSFGAFSQPLVENLADNDALYELIDSKFKDEGLQAKKPEIYQDWIQYSGKIIWNTLQAKLEGDFHLYKLQPGDAVAEMEYDMDASERKNMPTDFEAYCKGFMDLVFRRGDVYYIIDWKSDYLDSYDDKRIQARVDEAYFVQRILYPYVLIKWLAKILGKSEEEVFSQNFGGMYYVFLRGTRKDSDQGTHYYQWKSFKELKDEFHEKVEKKIYAIAH